MYQIIECDQRTPEWDVVRLGKPTGSVADKMVTSTGKRSAQVDELVDRLVAEIILGKADETFKSEAMERGSDLEGEALNTINFVTGFNFMPVGFFDSGLGYGFSPDGDDKESDIDLEMKCPLPHTHLKYLAGKVCPTKYYARMQFGLMVTGRKKSLFASYCPGLPLLTIDVPRDEVFIAALKKIVDECTQEVKEKVEELKSLMSEAA